MSWPAIISFLIQTFGPLLAEWLKKWLEDKLKSAAQLIAPPASFASAAHAHDALFGAAIASTSRFAFARRGLLRALRATAVNKADQFAGGPVSLSQAELDGLRDAAGAAENE